MGVQIKGRVKCDVCSRKPISCWVEQVGPVAFVPVDLPSGWKLETRSEYRTMLANEAAEEARKVEAARIAAMIEKGDRSALGGGLLQGQGFAWGIESGSSSKLRIDGYTEQSDHLATCSEDCRKAYEAQLRLSEREPDTMPQSTPPQHPNCGSNPSPLTAGANGEK